MKKLLFLALASVTFSTNVNSEWAVTPQVIDMISESKTKISPFILDKKLFILDDFDKKEFVSKNNQNEKIYAYGISGLANILVEDNSNLLKAKMEMSKLEPDYLSAAKLLYNCCLKMKLYGEIFNYLKPLLINVIDYSLISRTC